MKEAVPADDHEKQYEFGSADFHSFSSFPAINYSTTREALKRFMLIYWSKSFLWMCFSSISSYQRATTTATFTSFG